VGWSRVCSRIKPHERGQTAESKPTRTDGSTPTRCSHCGRETGAAQNSATGVKKVIAAKAPAEAE